MDQVHSLHQNDLQIQTQILNISVNMARIANLALYSYESKSALIKKFIEQTESYLEDISSNNISPDFKPTLERFRKEFYRLKRHPINNQNKMEWSERALTWADILQIRSKMA